MNPPAQRLLCVADVHAWNHRVHGGPMVAGLNTRCRTILAALRAARNLAIARRCSYFASLGDLTDGVRPEPQILAAIQAIFAEDDGLEFDVLLGNHEMVSTALGDHALGPLAALPNAAVIAGDPHVVGKEGVVDFAFVPFQPGPAKEWLPAAVKMAFEERAPAPARVLGLHLGITDKDTPEYIRGAHDAVHVDQLVEICGEHGIGVVVAGNWHRRAIWRGSRFSGVGAPGSRRTWAPGEPPVICQVGTLCPTGWDNPGLEGYGSAIEVGLTHKKGDDGLLELFVYEVPGPRFVTVKGADAALPESWGEAHKAGCEIFARHEVAAEDLERVRRDWSVPFPIAAHEVVSDGVDEASAMQGAAIAARSAGTIDDAVRGYVAAMQIPEGVDRAAVLSTVLKYLGRHA